MKILICGASGLVGSNLMQVLEDENVPCLGTYYTFAQDGLMELNTLDITAEQKEKIKEFNPTIIVHCGAMTHVDYCEDHVEESYQSTVQSTLNLLDLAQELKCKFVYLSTDYVFNGDSGPYVETDTLDPISVYGRHKLEAEEWVREKSEDYIILRITNVYGDEARNKNFVSRIIEKIKSKESIELKLPKDQYATPTNASDIANAIYMLMRDRKEGTYHLAGLEYMNRVDLATQILENYQYKNYTLEVFSTEELHQKAKRPLRGGLLRCKFSDEYPEFKWTALLTFLQQHPL